MSFAMSHDLVICLIAVAANLAGMLLIYSALSQALARIVWHRAGIFTVVAPIVVAQLFWIAPALWIVEAQGTNHAAAYALWFGNWLVTGFSLVLFWKSAGRIPRALDDAARSDGLGALGRWRHTVFPFVRRDLAIIAVFTIMATLLPFWGFINQPDAGNIITIFDRAPGLAEHIGMMVAASLLGALPLIAIFFVAKRSE
jgi:ABC-type glycerol-3-phosphate transport system permease component